MMLEDQGAGRGEAPAGTVTLLFTDIEGSTKLLQQLGDDYSLLQAEHQRIIRAACRAWDGYEVDTQGDSFFFSFQRAADAVAAAVEAQRQLAEVSSQRSVASSQRSVVSSQMADGGVEAPESSIVNRQSSVVLRIRMGIHTGEPQLVDGCRYIGLDVNRGARIAAAGHGGQVLLSQTTRDLVDGSLPEGVTIKDMGEHRLKDLRRPRRLYQLIIPGLPSEFPPLKTLNAIRHNLPTQVTTLVGRDADVQAVVALLRRDTVRLVTLTGPGGVGKTRLGLHAAAEVLDQFPDGVFFVPLAPVTDPELVLSAIAQALDVQESGGRSLLESLKARLKDQRLLLVLDNFEQVTLAGRLVTQLLQAAPRVKALVTSRAVLRVYGEQEYPVQPLPAPATDHRPPTTDDLTPHASRFTLHASRLTEYPSVDLFVQRAQMVKPDFKLTEQNATAVAGICARLDGLPLAIELAAARIKLLPPQAILPRLERRLTVLTQGSRDLPLRQQTLRASIDWSYDLLDEGGRTVFRRLAVFAGGFSLDAAEQIIDGPQSSLSLLEELESLVDESLVQQREDATGEPRFLMLETIREYALEKLDESGEAEVIRRRHADYYLHLAEAAYPHLTGAEQATWLSRLDTNHDNLRAALGWVRETHDTDLLLRLCSALWLFWYMRGYLSEGRIHLSHALKIAKDEVSKDSSLSRAALRLRARVFNGAATLAYAQADYPAARLSHELSLAILQRMDDRRGIGITLSQLGIVARAQGDYPTARKLLEESVAILEGLEDRQVLGWSLNNLGIIAHDQGDYSLAQSCLNKSLTIHQQLDDQLGIARLLNNLGEVAYDQNQLTVARCYYEKSQLTAYELGDKQILAHVLYNLGMVMSSQGDVSKARDLLERSLQIRREIGDKSGIGYCQRALGEILSRSDHLPEALNLLQSSMALHADIGDKRGFVETIETLAEVSHLCHLTTDAALFLSVADALRSMIGIPRRLISQASFDNLIHMVHSVLGDQEFLSLQAKGRAMSIKDLTDHVRNHPQLTAYRPDSI